MSKPEPTFETCVEVTFVDSAGRVRTESVTGRSPARAWTTRHVKLATGERVEWSRVVTFA